MTIARAALLACLCFGVALPAEPQVAPAPPSPIGEARGGPDRGSTPHDAGRPISISPPRWGGGPPPPSPFDRPLPGSLLTQRPGVDMFRAQPDTYAPRFSSGSGRGDGWRDGRGDGPRRGRRGDRGQGGTVYPSAGSVYIGASPYYYWPYVQSPVAQPTAAPPQRREDPEGFLRLAVTPRNAEVVIDGVYEGTVDDFGGSGERALPAGLHSVRVEADGFEPVVFDVRVPVNDTITLRRDLEPRRVPPLPPLAPPPVAAPSKPKTIYVIPRCYLGDSRPQPNQLPAGCSLADLRTLN